MDGREHRADDIEAISTLGEPVRRRLYEYVAAAHRAVGRDEAAAATGIGRPLAAFHLDRLVREGLLVPEYRRLTGRAGPGAGRPAKLYRRASRDVAVSLPRREYEIAADVFATALEDVSPAAPPPALLDAARAYGRRLADEVGGGFGTVDGSRPGTTSAVALDAEAPRPGTSRFTASLPVAPQAEAGAPARRLLDALERLGFEPFEQGRMLRLRNCPFDALSRDHRGLTCPANLALLESLVERLDPEAHPVAMPEEGYCCVAIELGASSTEA